MEPRSPVAVGRNRRLGKPATPGFIAQEGAISPCSCYETAAHHGPPTAAAARNRSTGDSATAWSGQREARDRDDRHARGPDLDTGHVVVPERHDLAVEDEAAGVVVEDLIGPAGAGLGAASFDPGRSDAFLGRGLGHVAGVIPHAELDDGEHHQQGHGKEHGHLDGRHAPLVIAVAHADFSRD